MDKPNWICKHCEASQSYRGIGKGGRIVWAGCDCPEPKLIDPATGREGAYQP